VNNAKPKKERKKERKEKRKEKRKNPNHLVRMWRHGTPCALLMGM